MKQATPPNAPITLPSDLTVLERGWLSANNMLFQGRHGTALVDSGYSSHADQTVDLVAASLNGKPLDLLINTHLHSDHCGGNAALQQHWPELITRIPPGQLGEVRDWNPVALGYQPTGQHCPPFKADGTLIPGTDVALGDRLWQVHAAPGHDTHAVILFEPENRLLISGDALWENGFGVVFPELDGEEAFGEVRATLDIIESLAPLVVLPGHGAVFADVPEAIARARKRLAGFEADPVKHARHAAKVLIIYKLLEWQKKPLAEVMDWLGDTPYFCLIQRRFAPDTHVLQWGEAVIQELVKNGAAKLDGPFLMPA